MGHAGVQHHHLEFGVGLRNSRGTGTEGISQQETTSRNGNTRGGQPFSRGSLFHCCATGSNLRRSCTGRDLPGSPSDHHRPRTVRLRPVDAEAAAGSSPQTAGLARASRRDPVRCFGQPDGGHPFPRTWGPALRFLKKVKLHRKAIVVDLLPPAHENWSVDPRSDAPAMRTACCASPRR